MDDLQPRTDGACGSSGTSAGGCPHVGSGRGEARSLADALAQALGPAADRSLTPEEVTAEAKWIRNHADQVEREFRRKGGA